MGGVDMESMFTVRLKEMRTERGLTQKELAKQAGMAIASYSGYELGEKNPPLPSAIRLAQALNVSLDWLCGYAASTEAEGLESRGDVVQVLIALDKTGLRMLPGADAIPAREDKMLDEDEIFYLEDLAQREYADTFGAFGGVALSHRGILNISDVPLAQFFKKWAALREQFRNGTLDEELYQLWYEKQIAELKNSPLPFAEKRVLPSTP
jgi:transcriptional regulator with XRE-family HTH domain